MLTVKKVKEPTMQNAVVEYQVLDESGKEVARLYRKRVSKTGFKKGRTVGQVKVLGWFFRLIPSHPYDEFGKSEGMAGGPKWTKQSDAMGALAMELRDRAAVVPR